MNQYDGILRKPFLAEHWHKGFVAACAIWLPVFLLFLSTFGADETAAIVVASLFSSMVALSVWTHHEGFSIDLNQQRYRSYVWVAGLHVGRWEKLPSIARIVVRPYQHQHTLSMTNGYPVKSGFAANERGWQVLLSVTNSPIGIVAAYAKQEEATRIAAVLSKLFGVEILVTEPNSPPTMRPVSAAERR